MWCLCCRREAIPVWVLWETLSLHLTVNLSSRKIPGLNVYAQMQNEKEQEMMSPANPTEAPPSSQRDLVHSLEILDTEFNSRPIGEYPLLSVVSVAKVVFSIAHFIQSVFYDSSCAFSCVFLRSEVVRSRGERELNRNEYDKKCSCFSVGWQMAGKP